MQPSLRRKGRDVASKMEALARFILEMEPEEIQAFIEALVPEMPQDEREDLYSLILFEQRRNDLEGRLAEEVFADIEKDKSLDG